MTVNRRGFLAALLAVPLAASRAISKVVRGPSPTPETVYRGIKGKWEWYFGPRPESISEYAWNSFSPAMKRLITSRRKYRGNPV